MDRLAVRTSAPDAVMALADRFSRVLSISADEAASLAFRFSLAALRASAGVIVYFKTKSVRDMATALGHAKYDMKLLDRYLPKVIRQFFEDRWIRIFQTGVIVQALEGSQYQLEASGFKTIKELDEFLLNHAIKLPKSRDTASNATSERNPWAVGALDSPREAIFGLNEEILTTLISLDLASASADRQLTPRARYWVETGRALLPYVELAGSNRPDIQTYLKRARLRADARLVEHIAYAK